VTIIKDMTQADYAALLQQELTNVLELIRRLEIVLVQRPCDALTTDVRTQLARASTQLLVALGRTTGGRYAR
jgi:ABC-type Fe3+/spermidine/putrescine transport system ATPase subunit